MSDQAALRGIDNAVSALPQPSAVAALIPTGTLTQNFNSNISTVVSVANARRVTLIVSHDAHASATDGTVWVLPMLSNANTAPAIGDDSWHAAPVPDIASTDADLGSGVTLPTGADFTKGPVWRRHPIGGLIFSTEGASSGEKVRVRLPRLDVDDARWMYVAAIQQGDTTNFGTVKVDYCVSI